mgnify:CR=1 FL=1
MAALKCKVCGGEMVLQEGRGICLHCGKEIAPEKVYENNCMFGIVKTAHESKLGDVQKMSYQMVNSLDEKIMEKNIAHTCCNRNCGRNSEIFV